MIEVIAVAVIAALIFTVLYDRKPFKKDGK
jgi:hypothetical protein